jgi:hypothetical protein
VLRQVVVDRTEVDAYELPLGELGTHHAAGDERIGRDDRLRRGEVVATQDVSRPDAWSGFDEVSTEQNEVLGYKGVDEGLMVDVDLTEPRALEQSHKDVHMPIVPDRARARRVLLFFLAMAPF